MAKCQDYYYEDPEFQLELNLQFIRRQLVNLLDDDEDDGCFVCNRLKCCCSPTHSSLLSATLSIPSIDSAYSNESDPWNDIHIPNEHISKAASPAETLPKLKLPEAVTPKEQENITQEPESSETITASEQHNITMEDKLPEITTQKVQQNFFKEVGWPVTVTRKEQQNITTEDKLPEIVTQKVQQHFFKEVGWPVTVNQKEQQNIRKRETGTQKVQQNFFKEVGWPVAATREEQQNITTEDKFPDIVTHKMQQTFFKEVGWPVSVTQKEQQKIWKRETGTQKWYQNIGKQYELPKTVIQKRQQNITNQCDSSDSINAWVWASMPELTLTNAPTTFPTPPRVLDDINYSWPPFPQSIWSKETSQDTTEREEFLIDLQRTQQINSIVTSFFNLFDEKLT